jgi:hypothetical protein
VKWSGGDLLLVSKGDRTKLVDVFFSIINFTNLSVLRFILDELKKCGHECLLMPVYLAEHTQDVGWG